jgi:hypothetical protein
LIKHDLDIRNAGEQLFVSVCAKMEVDWWMERQMWVVDRTKLGFAFGHEVLQLHSVVSVPEKLSSMESRRNERAIR